ncbi:hypothetical protein C1J00_42155 [Streptomyces cahuitamycinicus]|uniref:Uncharacterized protein n=1 Tax=Streptomyces cahuitamycinicus TaxID=2070367 RepID=A0A2N8TBJ5_9ACTN|nr:hypothetical protein C1J00_42155 [Streptomyces cahuitamycinicus]
MYKGQVRVTSSDMVGPSSRWRTAGARVGHARRAARRRGRAARPLSGGRVSSSLARSAADTHRVRAPFAPVRGTHAAVPWVVRARGNGGQVPWTGRAGRGSLAAGLLERPARERGGLGDARQWR